ncbi:hypothetical protein [Natronosalvus rutilus]|uniref:Uncharacterized protein n=1 Tax=Natronosalvus rutilus TaxID=2953753 RepID=A0A9E7NCW1_9EURY|nr:hypothetical protein [Natronosalvus rutilus]UTF54528.1 hypothetical protein NGM29_04445 [Natronosalvus rutilus]
MSTDVPSLPERATPGPVLELLDHPWIGLERRRTVAVGVYLCGLLALFLIGYFGGHVRIDDVVLDSLTVGFDSVRMIAIALVAPTILLIPLCYAAWNGGPALSFTLPLVPVTIGDLLAGGYVLDLDIALALTVGASAAAVALVSADVRRLGSVRVWRSSETDVDRLLFVTALVVVAAVGVGRFVAAAPAYVLEWYAPFGGLWIVATAILGFYWVRWAWSLSADRARSSESV